MSKEKSQHKFSFESAQTLANTAIKILLECECSFSTQYDPHKKFIVITSKQGCDLMKIKVPHAQVQVDTRSERYCELRLEYA